MTLKRRSKTAGTPVTIIPVLVSEDTEVVVHHNPLGGWTHVSVEGPQAVEVQEAFLGTWAPTDEEKELIKDLVLLIFEPRDKKATAVLLRGCTLGMSESGIEGSMLAKFVGQGRLEVTYHRYSQLVRELGRMEDESEGEDEY